MICSRLCSWDLGSSSKVCQVTVLYLRCLYAYPYGIIRTLLGKTSPLRNILWGPGGASAAAAWKLHYFEWIMQIFERYSLNEGARRFAHAALEQVNEAMANYGEASTADSVKGRLWANVFKFSLDLELYEDAYCAIISNPDGESQHTCLRRFIVVLCEKKAAEVRMDTYAAATSHLMFLLMVRRVIITCCHMSRFYAVVSCHMWDFWNKLSKSLL